MQTHVWYNTDLKLEKLQNFLRNIAGLGLKILATQMDVMDKDLPTDIAIRDRVIAGLYGDILSVIVEESTVIGVNTWEIGDKRTWISANAPKDESTSVDLISCDCDMRRKLAWNGIARAFAKATKRKHSSQRWTAWKKQRYQS